MVRIAWGFALAAEKVLVGEPLEVGAHGARQGEEHVPREDTALGSLWEAGLRYRLNYKVPAGRPDIVFPGSKVAVSVDGCFWHGCPAHYSRPRSREEFWSQKLAANTERDSRLTLRLESFGWIVVMVWEHEIFTQLDEVVEVVRQATQGVPPPAERDWRVVRVVPVPQEGEDWERRELRLLRDQDVVRYEVGPRKTGRDKGRPKTAHATRRTQDRGIPGSGRRSS